MLRLTINKNGSAFSKSYMTSYLISVKTYIILWILATTVLFSGCNGTNNTVSEAKDTSIAKTTIADEDINKAVEQFIEDFQLNRDYNGQPIICDINNDEISEVVLYNTNYKEEDGGHTKILAVYNLDTFKKITQLEGSIDPGFEVAYINNPKYKNSIIVSSGTSGYIAELYYLKGNKLLNYGTFEGEESRQLEDIDEDGYQEILTKVFNENSMSQDDKYIDVTLKWDGDNYININGIIDANLLSEEGEGEEHEVEDSGEIDKKLIGRWFVIDASGDVRPEIEVEFTKQGILIITKNFDNKVDRNTFKYSTFNGDTIVTDEDMRFAVFGKTTTITYIFEDKSVIILSSEDYQGKTKYRFTKVD